MDNNLNRVIANQRNEASPRMSVLSMKRVVLFLGAVAICTPLLANYPSPRTAARMAYDEKNRVGVMFGGRGPRERATGVIHGNTETWIWTGAQWSQRHPDNHPAGRSAHMMVYDSKRERIVLFGGRAESDDPRGFESFLNDTWVWENGNWSQLAPAQSPPARQVAGMVYDKDRDRIVLYGGNAYGADGKTPVILSDTWEFDGDNWVKVGNESTKVGKPILAYDPGRKQLLLVGVKEGTLDRLMYVYEPATSTWAPLTPTVLPTCVNEGHMIFQEHTGAIRFVGGVCVTGTPDAEEVYDWNGTNWVKKTLDAAWSRGFGQASTYDSTFERIVLFGGSTLFSSADGSYTTVLETTRFALINYGVRRPTPRSLATTATDTVNNTVWLFGGLDETGTSTLADFWGYRNGNWFLSSATGGPDDLCTSPLSAFDSDRGRLVVACSGGKVYEWDNATWKTFAVADKDDVPDTRSFARLVYDKKLKKTVLFGGYNLNNYRNDTWTWDGTKWTELDIDNKNRPERRGLMAMWYDPLQEKTIIYGGFGRASINDSVTRHEDMWAFDGTKWTKLTVDTPGPRFGPQVAVNPLTGKVLLFGGLRSAEIDEDSTTQFFDNDTWEWDGAASRWTQLEPQHRPSVRENGMLFWDPLGAEMVLFGGFANGFYRSDVWTWTGLDWEPQIDRFGRRRAASN
jgi:N-acetylneuraminic acid mutarotase